MYSLKIQILLRILTFFFSSLVCVSSIEFQKNINIESSRKGNESFVQEISIKEELNDLIELNESVIVVFYADWCGHW